MRPFAGCWTGAGCAPGPQLAVATGLALRGTLPMLRRPQPFTGTNTQPKRGVTISWSTTTDSGSAVSKPRTETPVLLGEHAPDLSDQDIIAMQLRMLAPTKSNRLHVTPDMSYAEAQRRIKICLANSGRQPWNKGKQHSEGRVIGAACQWWAGGFGAEGLAVAPCAYFPAAGVCAPKPPTALLGLPDAPLLPPRTLLPQHIHTHTNAPHAETRVKIRLRTREAMRRPEVKERLVTALQQRPPPPPMTEKTKVLLGGEWGNWGVGF